MVLRTACDAGWVPDPLLSQGLSEWSLPLCEIDFISSHTENRMTKHNPKLRLINRSYLLSNN